MNDRRTEHWQSVYRTKAPSDVSWFRPHLDVSLELLQLAGLKQNSRIIDVGAGASTLVDDLLDRGVRDITAFDLSATSLEIAQRRLGPRAAQVHWMVGDAARYSFAPTSFDIWHDRAALHFLVDANDSAAYVANAAAALTDDGHLIVGCFASDGPEKCSGLPVVRRDPEEIANLFGSNFELIASRRERHLTPMGTSQSFAYALLKKRRR